MWGEASKKVGTGEKRVPVATTMYLVPLVSFNWLLLAERHALFPVSDNENVRHDAVFRAFFFGLGRAGQKINLPPSFFFYSTRFLVLQPNRRKASSAE